MKKSHFPKAEYQVAMSLETGCIVMVKSVEGKQQVMGSLDRASSMKFAHELMQWRPPLLEASPQDREATVN